ncbi:MAG: FAD-binding protein, partial [Hyphomicrobiaceae bacterium]|nr:FAD-binding protein [Hyphomicrobiaceae bacterium]
GRDHLLGISAVSGRAQTFNSGGRVLKDVAGIGLTRAVAGSWGTLAVITRVTFKVKPKPEETATVVLIGLSNELAVEAMGAALAMPFDVTAGVHLETSLVKRLQQEDFQSVANPITALRLETFSKFLPRRIEFLKKALKTYGELYIVGNDASIAFWNELQQLSPMLGSDRQVWRISTLLNKGAHFINDIRRHMEVEVYFDWFGGLMWLLISEAVDAGAADIRRTLATYGGHATLIRATDKIRSQVSVFQPLDSSTEHITRNLKHAFDPDAVLNRARMYTYL